MREYEQFNRNWAHWFDESVKNRIHEVTGVAGVSSAIAYRNYRSFERKLLDAKRAFYTQPALWDTCVCPKFIADVFDQRAYVETEATNSIRFRGRAIPTRTITNAHVAQIPILRYPIDPFIHRPTVLLLTAGGPALEQAVARATIYSEKLAHFMVGWDGDAYRCVQTCDVSFPLPCVDTPKWVNAMQPQRMHQRAVVVQLCFDPLIGAKTYMDSWPSIFTGESLAMPNGNWHTEMPLGFAAYVSDVIAVLTRALNIETQIPRWEKTVRTEAFSNVPEFCGFYGVCATHHVTPNRTEMLTWWPSIDRELVERHGFSQFKPIYADPHT